MLVFAAALQGWFFDRNRIWETVALLLVAFSLFRPGFWMDMIYPPYDVQPPAEFTRVIAEAPPGTPVQTRIAGLGPFGDPIEFAVLLPVPEGDTAEARIEALGLTLIDRDGKLIIDNVAFDSPGQKVGLDWDQEILAVREPLPQPHRYWIFIPTLLVLAGIVWLQRARIERRGGQPARAAA
jgi:hypothetical protein